MFTLEQYSGGFILPPDHLENARKLIVDCTRLYNAMVKEGVNFKINPVTKSNISGIRWGGYRTPECTEGAPKSNHRIGGAVDWYDPDGEIDAWLSLHPIALYDHGIFIEHPDKTPGWSHWSNMQPKSGKHIFYP